MPKRRQKGSGGSELEGREPMVGVVTGWAWFGPFAHIVRGSEVVRTFRGPLARRRAQGYLRDA